MLLVIISETDPTPKIGSKGWVLMDRFSGTVSLPPPAIECTCPNQQPRCLDLYFIWPGAFNILAEYCIFVEIASLYRGVGIRHYAAD